MNTEPPAEQPRRTFARCFIIALSLALYIWLQYFTSRTDFWLVISLYGGLFVGYFLLLRLEGSLFSYRLLLLSAVAFRIVLLFGLPNLSDDIYRFIWDGRLLAFGENPFTHLPSHYLDGSQPAVTGIDAALYGKLNSPNYYTIYPPVCQLIFYFSCKVFPDSVLGASVFMKTFILLADVGNIFLLQRLAGVCDISRRTVLLYVLNPLVIVECVGNVHFEAVMVFFLLLALYLLATGAWVRSAASLTLAVGVKLMPLILLPFLIKRLGARRSIAYWLLVGGLSLVMFSPFLGPEELQHFFASVQLYFRKFEFNASLYALIRWIGKACMGDAIFAVAGWTLGGITAVSILLMAFAEKQDTCKSLPQTLLLALSCYYLLATTVHPWYLTTLVALSALSAYRYPLVWAALIPLTYITYRSTPYQQSHGLVAFEYAAVLLWLGYEVWRIRCRNQARSPKPEA